MCDHPNGKCCYSRQFSIGEITEDEPGYLLATAMIFGVEHHVEFIRVNNRAGTQDVWLPRDGTNWNTERLESLRTYEPSTDEFNTVKVPGHPGNYVCVITPYGY